MRNGFTAGFFYFLGRKKNLDKKKHFLCGKICKFFEEKKKNVIKKKNEKTFFLGKTTVNPLRKKNPVPKKTQIAF